MDEILIVLVIVMIVRHSQNFVLHDTMSCAFVWHPFLSNHCQRCFCCRSLRSVMTKSRRVWPTFSRACLPVMMVKRAVTIAFLPEDCDCIFVWCACVWTCLLGLMVSFFKKRAPTSLCNIRTIDLITFVLSSRVGESMYRCRFISMVTRNLRLPMQLQAPELRPQTMSQGPGCTGSETLMFILFPIASLILIPLPFEWEQNDDKSFKLLQPTIEVAQFRMELVGKYAFPWRTPLLLGEAETIAEGRAFGVKRSDTELVLRVSLFALEFVLEFVLLPLQSVVLFLLVLLTIIDGD